MTTPREQREQALGAAESTCPRCGAVRAPDQEYCVECGLRLPPVEGRLPSLRRQWIRRVGWYPGDWLWISLLTLLVAVAGAAIAIVVTRHDRAAAGATVVAPTAAVSVQQPSTPAGGASTLPQAPEQTVSTPAKPRPPATKNGPLAWPAHRDGWTIVLVSYPKATGGPASRSTAASARKAGLPEVGVLDSSVYPSLQPGYLVVFAGVYGSQDDAAAALPTARQAGFAGAYVRQVAG